MLERKSLHAAGATNSANPKLQKIAQVVRRQEVAKACDSDVAMVCS